MYQNNKKYLLLVGYVLLLLSHTVLANDMWNVLHSLANTKTVHQSQAPGIRHYQGGQRPLTKTIVYAGYAKTFLPIKQLITQGQWQQAYTLQKQKIADDVNFLDSVETGLLALDSHQLDDSLKYFTEAEQYLKLQAEKSVVEDGVVSFGSEAFSVITGAGEVTDYNGEPFERILMLNYKSIAYLLNGERKAYNVTRRAIDWQNIEHKEFEQTLELAKKEINQKQAEINEHQNNKKLPDANNIFQVIADQYGRSKKIALSVPSAYVNPFGFYMAGIVQEFDSFDEPALRDNARISYKKALKLNPKSKVIKQALREVKRRPRAKKRLVHVVIADGFAPAKKLLQFVLPMPGGLVPVKLPIYEVVPSKIAHIKIKSGRRTLATVSSVANIEAIVLRHQLDSLPLQHFKVIASIARSTAENMLWGQLGVIGQIGKSFRESFANPDLRGWMSLPKQLLAARFYVSKRIRKISIVSYDKRWRRLATSIIELPQNKHSFIYARTIDDQINANVNKTLWVN